MAEKIRRYISEDPAPQVPNGPTTNTALVSMIVGLIVAVLSLFDVVPTDEDVQALGVIVGAVLVVVPYIVMAISRTKQANNLAKLAQGERIAERTARPLATGGTIPTGSPVPTVSIALGDVDPAAIAEATKRAQGIARVRTGAATEAPVVDQDVQPPGGAGRRRGDEDTHDTRPRAAGYVRKAAS